MNLKKLHPGAHQSFKSMRGRCNNPKATSYHLYGGRGIAVCARWANFAAFVADMGDRPSLEHTLDRIDPNGNYEPENCRWANKHIQSLNRRPYLETPMYQNNTSGYKGVSRVGNNWIARTKVNGTSVHLGSFSDIREAAEAYIYATADCFRP